MLEIAQAGFIVTPEDETACRVVLTWAFKPAKKVAAGLAKAVVSHLLGKLREHEFKEQQPVALPEELTL